MNDLSNPCQKIFFCSNVGRTENCLSLFKRKLMLLCNYVEIFFLKGRENLKTLVTNFGNANGRRFIFVINGHDWLVTPIQTTKLFIE